jgi:hypothetical protein
MATRAGRTYRARVRHQDNAGHWSAWSEPLEFTASQPDISLYTDSLVISELMYHPADPSAAEIAAGFDDDDFFEYVEVRNVGTQTLDLSDVRFTRGVDIDLSGTIAPGEFVLVVNNITAFEMRHGGDLPVIGEWSGKLDNGGENVKLSFGAGEAIREFVYDDIAPWPTDADGAGSALVLVDPFGLPDHASPFSWRAATQNPGTTDSTMFPGGDLLDYATGGPVNVTLLPDGSATFEIELNLRAEDLRFGWQRSDDLSSWAPVDIPITATAPAAMGFTTTFSLPPQPGELRRFYRFVAEQR